MSIHEFSALAWQEILFPLLSLLAIPHCPSLNSLNFLFLLCLRQDLLLDLYLLKKKSFSSSKEALRTFLVLMISSFVTNVYFLSPFNSLPLSSTENVLLTKGCDFIRVSWFSKVIPSAKLIYICFKEVGGISLQVCS